MASRENQTMQILVMVLFFILVVLAGLSYWMYRSYDKTSKQLADKTEENQSTLSTNRQLLGENDQLKVWLGFSSEQGMEEVEKAFTDDMSTYAENLSEESRDYRKTLQSLHSELLRTDERAVEAISERDELERKLKAVESATEEKIAQFQTQYGELDKDLRAERKKFEDERARLQAENVGFEEKRKTLLDQNVALKRKMEAEIAQLNEQLVNQKRLYSVLLEQTEGLRQDENLDRADGKVTLVSPQTNLVWLNIGRRDNLKPQVTFSVFSSNEHNIGSAERKGAIEVVRVNGDYSAEARIIDFSFDDPIISGDLVYSNVWSPGQEDGFALAGVLDLNGDGLGDSTLVRNLIRRNGGKVDAELSTDGETIGELKVSTKYLVLGETPTVSAAEATASASDYISRFSAFKKEALELGIQVVPIHRFVEMMGYEPDEQLVPTRGSRSARDIHATLRSSADSDVSAQPNDFQPRQSPGRGAATP